MDIYILTIAVIYVIIRLFIDILQISFINNHKITNDEIEKLEINVKDYDIAKSYNLSKLYLSLGCGFIKNLYFGFKIFIILLIIFA